jgi:NADPH-dependent 7-cyano-7-deazaguanine reductase QueF-like protein
MSKCEKRCEDCIHCGLCLNIDRLTLFDKNQEAHCKAFKDKSLIVELPCKVGDIVWEICYDIHYNRMSSVPYIATSRVVSIHIEEEVLIETKNANYYIEHIGKRLFFTKEDAEAKLKEINEINNTD